MATFKVSLKHNINTNGVKAEKGTSVEITADHKGKVTANNLEMIEEAFNRVHGIDLKKACKLGTSNFDIS